LELARVRRTWADELAQANKELEAFSFSVSHDLRAPLRGIDGFSKLLLDEYGEKLDDKASSYLNRIRTGTQKMAGLIDELLNLSQIARTPMRREPIDLTKLAHGVIDELRQREPARKITVEIAEALSANADGRLLRIVLDNLLGMPGSTQGSIRKPTSNLHSRPLKMRLPSAFGTTARDSI